MATSAKWGMESGPIVGHGIGILGQGLTQVPTCCVSDASTLGAALRPQWADGPEALSPGDRSAEQVGFFPDRFSERSEALVASGHTYQLAACAKYQAAHEWLPIVQAGVMNPP